MDRVIDVEFNKFPPKPPSKLVDVITNDLRKELEIDLLKLASTFRKEEFGDDSKPPSYDVYPALHYLLPSTNLFKFSGGQPGHTKDARNNNSRILGQCISRYFINEYLDTEYVANVSEFIGKQLNKNFNNVKIERKSKGDTPDFISAKDSATIFLTEAKGRRRLFTFDDPDFDDWRKQFERISIKSGNTEISLKGYIILCCIANEENAISNSKLLIEDPITSGTTFQYEDNLFDLIKCGHYKNILSKMKLGFIGNSLIYKDNLRNIKPRLPIFTSQITNKEYVGVFSSRFHDKYFDYPFYKTPDFYYYLSSISDYFYGIDRHVFQYLIEIARGDYNYLNNLKLNNIELLFNESSIEFKDGTIITDPNLISFKQLKRF